MKTQKRDVVIERLDEWRYAVAVDGLVRYVGSQAGMRIARCGAGAEERSRQARPSPGALGASERLKFGHAP
jgi:hypothetical protein